MKGCAFIGEWMDGGGVPPRPAFSSSRSLSGAAERDAAPRSAREDSSHVSTTEQATRLCAESLARRCGRVRPASSVEDRTTPSTFSSLLPSLHQAADRAPT